MTKQQAWGWSKAAAAAAVIGLAIAIVSCVFGEGTRRGSVETRIDRMGQCVDDHEGRIRCVETKIDEIAVDVRWLRKTEESKQ